MIAKSWRDSSESSADRREVDLTVPKVEDGREVYLSFQIRTQINCRNLLHEQS
jgi:hypothetical protein